LERYQHQQLLLNDIFIIVLAVRLNMQDIAPNLTFLQRETQSLACGVLEFSTWQPAFPGTAVRP